MIYIYDILVNMNEELIDFYDWNENDNYLHLRRCPLFKISHEAYSDFVYKKVKVNNDFLSIIRDKTQSFSSKNIEIVAYMAVVSDGVNALAIMLNSKGNIISKSKFLVNEEIEILDVVSGIKESFISYEVVSNKIIRSNMIRSDKVVLSKILNELNLLKDDQEKINYLYYEWFDKDDGVNKYEDLVNDLKKCFTDKHNDFLELLHLLTVKK